MKVVLVMKVVLTSFFMIGTIAVLSIAPQASKIASATLIACSLPSDPPPKEPPSSY